MGADNAFYKTLPIIALTANAIKGSEELFLAAGMNGFVPKPIERAALNSALARWLPQDKLLFQEGETKPVTTEVNEEDTARTRLLFELRMIKELDTEKGLYYFQGEFDGYKTALRQFCRTLGAELALADKGLAEKNWKIYAGQVHALKGVLATLGAAELSNESKRLEFAAKLADKSLCVNNHGKFKEALLSFEKSLKETSLFVEAIIKKEKVTTDDFIKKLTVLVKACEKGSPDEVDECAAEIKKLETEPEIESEINSKLKEVFSLVETMDYDEAGAMCSELIARLEK
jgi:HPt (histidine-containing phosphotransfer) domain-containing protein